jgi:hypothetical protein
MLPCPFAYRLLALAFVALMLTEQVVPQQRTLTSPRSTPTISSAEPDLDTASRMSAHVVSDVVKRVDSLQLMILYNADLVRREINNRVTWIYILLSALFVTNVLMFFSFNQIRRQTQALEDSFQQHDVEMKNRLESVAIPPSQPDAGVSAPDSKPRRPLRAKTKRGR